MDSERKSLGSKISDRLFKPPELVSQASPTVYDEKDLTERILVGKFAPVRS